MNNIEKSCNKSCKVKWYQQFPCLALNIEKGNTGSFPVIKTEQKKIVDQICDGNPFMSEIIGCCCGDEKTNDHAELTKLMQIII